MKKFVIKTLRGKPKLIKISSQILNIVAIITLIFWLINVNSNIDLEALFVLLTTIAVFFNQIHKWLLEDAEYSPSYALAIGYVNNFLEPAIVQLIEDGVKEPIFYIYKPESIIELFKSNIDKTKAIIKNNSLELNEIQLNLKHGRARDILTIHKSKTKMIYFDFPNTLLSLTAYINFKIESKVNKANDEQKKELTQLLFYKFYSKVDELIKERNIENHIKYCNKELTFNF